MAPSPSSRPLRPLRLTSPSPATSHETKAPLNRLAQVSKMLQQAREVALLGSKVQSDTHTATASLVQGLQPPLTSHALPHQTPRHRQTPSPSLVDLVPPVSLLVSLPSVSQSAAEQHVPARLDSTAQTPSWPDGVSSLTDKFQPRIAWGFGTRVTQPPCAVRGPSQYGSHSGDVTDTLVGRAQPVEVQRQITDSTATSLPEWTKQLIPKAERPSVTLPMEIGAPVTGVQATPTHDNDRSGQATFLSLIPQIIELADEDGAMVTTDVALDSPVTSTNTKRQHTPTESLATLSSARPSMNSLPRRDDATPGHPKADERPNDAKSVIPSSADRGKWGSFSLSMLGEAESVPSWDGTAREWAPPPDARSESTAAESQTQSQSDTSTANAKQAGLISARKATGSDGPPHDPVQQRDWALTSSTAPQTRLSSPLGNSPSAHSEAPLSLPAVRAAGSKTMGQIFPPHRENNGLQTGIQPLRGMSTPIATTTDSGLQRSETTRAKTAGQDMHSSATSDQKAIAATYSVAANETRASGRWAIQSDESVAHAGGLAAEPLVDVGWSMSVQAGGSWEQGKSVPLYPAAKPDSTPSLFHRDSQQSDESLPFSLRTVSLTPADLMLSTGTEAEIVADVTCVDQDEQEVEQSIQASPCSPSRRSPSRHRLQEAASRAPLPPTFTADPASCPALARSPSPVTTHALTLNAFPRLERGAQSRVTLVQAGNLRRGHTPGQAVEIMCPVAPRQRGNSSLVCDGRVPRSVTRADRKRSWDVPIARESGIEPERDSSEEKDDVANGIRTSARQSFAVNKNEHSGALLSTKQEATGAPSVGPTKPKKTYASRGRLRNRFQDQPTEDEETQTSDDSDESQQPLHSRRITSRASGGSFRQDARALGRRTLAPRLQGASDESSPLMRETLARANEDPMLHLATEDGDDDSEEENVKGGITRFPAKSSRRSTASPELSASASDANVLADIDGGVLSVTSPELAPPGLQSPPDVSTATSEDTGHRSGRKVPTAPAAGVACAPRSAPRLIPFESGLSITDTLKRLDAEHAAIAAAASAVEAELMRTRPSIEPMKGGAANVHLGPSGNSPHASTANDLERLREEQDDIRREQAWLRGQDGVAERSMEMETERPAAKCTTDCDFDSEPQTDSWTEPRLQRIDLTRCQPGERASARAKKEMRPLGRLVGELLRNAQTSGTPVGQTVSDDGLGQPDSGVTGVPPQKASVGACRVVSVTNGALGKRSRMDPEEGRRKLARLLRAIRD